MPRRQNREPRVATRLMVEQRRLAGYLLRLHKRLDGMLQYLDWLEQAVAAEGQALGVDLAALEAAEPCLYGLEPRPEAPGLPLDSAGFVQAMVDDFVPGLEPLPFVLEELDGSHQDTVVLTLQLPPSAGHPGGERVQRLFDIHSPIGAILEEAARADSRLAGGTLMVHNGVVVGADDLATPISQAGIIGGGEIQFLLTA